MNRWKPTSIILEIQYGIPLQVGRWDFHASKTAGDDIINSQYFDPLTSLFPCLANNLNPQFPTSMCSSHHTNKIQTKIPEKVGKNNRALLRVSALLTVLVTSRHPPALYNHGPTMYCISYQRHNNTGWI
jgi:hypothetical protein